MYKNVYILIKNTSLLKYSNHHDPLMNYNLFTGGGPYFDVNGCSLISMVLAQGWDGCSRFLKKVCQ